MEECCTEQKILIQCDIKFDLQIYMYSVGQGPIFCGTVICLIFLILFDEQASFFGYWF